MKINRQYYEVAIHVPDESRDAVIYKITQMGSSGVLEREGILAAYFEDMGNIGWICEELEGFRNVLKSSGLNPDFTFEYILLPELDWNETWKKNFVPIDVGENLTIIPSWIKADTGRIPVIIDPGMVFGTGHHETTKACLELIERLSGTCNRNSFLDLGTGSGILAVAAARLGFQHVIAVDTDPLCTDAAQRNAALNSFDNIEVRQGTVFDIKGSFDLIVANLISETLISDAYAISERLNPDGFAILSGMLIGQEDDVINAMGRAGLALKDKHAGEKWISLVLRKETEK